MSKAQVKIKDIAAIIRRRKFFLFLPPIIMTIISITGAYMLPRMYESSIRILVQRTEVQNPLASLANAMTSRDDDPLRSFDDIIFSQRTISQLIDSLDLAKNITNEAEFRVLMVKVRNNIQTKVQPRESFSITYASDNPVQAQRGATILADIFIQTRSTTKNKKNELTVDFYQKKLDEYSQKLENSQKNMVSLLKQRAKGTPGANTFLYTRVEQFDQQIHDIGITIKQYEGNLAQVKTLPSLIGSKLARQSLFELQRSDVPYSIELRSQLSMYDEVSSKYTPKHPEVVKVESRILELLERIRVALGSEISKFKSQINDIQTSRSQTIEEIMNSSVVQQEDRDKESNYTIYERLYNEMKLKLEEAQISLSIGQDSENQYTVMDPPLLPLFPSKPSRMLIILGGFIVGIIVGLFSVMGAELLDTTIRTTAEIQVYKKPIIALLPEWKND
ncbi:MAG: Wzz/FepE/Etk N-terminal domain-containing protein [Bacteroidota bacterium]|nr:Wzz/FepE/Etk N-terminal domain-containing protein [Bacteroidota bacterium]